MSLDDYSKVYELTHADWSGGHNDTIKSTLLRDNEGQFLLNASLEQRGTLYPCWGSPKRYAEVVYNAAVDGAGFFVKSDGTKAYCVVAIGTSLYYDDLSSGTPSLVLISDTFTASSSWDFKALNGVLYVCNGKDKLAKWDGTTFTRLDALTYIFSSLEVHNNRLWGVEVNSVRVRYSAILDGSTWETTNSLEFSSGEGDNVLRLDRFMSNLLVYKRRSKALVTGDKSANYSIIWLEGHGVVSPNGACVTDELAVYVGSDGVRYLDGNDDKSLTDDKLETSWKSRVNKDALNKVAVETWRNYVFIALPVDGSSYNNELWIYDLIRRAWIVKKNYKIACFAKLYLDGDEVLFAGDAATGQLYHVFKFGEIRDADGNFVEFDWKSKDWTFKYPNRYKLFKNVFIEMEGVRELTKMDVYMYVDNVEYEVPTQDVAVPEGEGDHRVVRLIPPVYGAVFGKILAIRVKGRAGVRSIKVEYSLRSTVPPGGVV